MHGARDEGGSKEEQTPTFAVCTLWSRNCDCGNVHIVSPIIFRIKKKKGKYNNYFHSAEETLRRSKVKRFALDYIIGKL